MLRYRTQGLLAVGLGLFAGGCFGDPDIRTDLRNEGPPDVLVGMGESLVTAEQLPFFCRYVNGVRDDKTPGFVIDAILGSQTVCPDEQGDFAATDVDPRGYGIRIMFDELLDGDAVETLDCDEEGICVGSMATTQPVTFTCGATNTAVDYDGYYIPNGNNTTFPLGPALAIYPASVDFATGSNCTISMTDAVHDRSGNKVDAAQADVDFTIAALALLGTSPSDAEDVADREVLDGTAATTEVDFAFNAYIDENSIDATDFELRNLDTNAVVASSAFVTDADAGGDAIGIGPDADLPAGNYVARLKMGAMFAEVNGGTITLSADEDVRFVVE
jgi:hypothetical protein